MRTFTKDDFEVKPISLVFSLYGCSHPGLDQKRGRIFSGCKQKECKGKYSLVSFTPLSPHKKCIRYYVIGTKPPFPFGLHPVFWPPHEVLIRTHPFQKSFIGPRKESLCILPHSVEIPVIYFLNNTHLVKKLQNVHFTKKKNSIRVYLSFTHTVYLKEKCQYLF